MGHFAKVENGTVTQVIVVGNDILGEPNAAFPETELAGQEFIANKLRLAGNFYQTSYNGSFRGRYAGIGFTYDEATDEFVPPGWEYIDGEWQDPNPPEPI
jgi:hypothetical protein